MSTLKEVAGRAIRDRDGDTSILKIILALFGVGFITWVFLVLLITLLDALQVLYFNRFDYGEMDGPLTLAKEVFYVALATGGLKVIGATVVKTTAAATGHPEPGVVLPTKPTVPPAD